MTYEEFKALSRNDVIVSTTAKTLLGPDEWRVLCKAKFDRPLGIEVIKLRHFIFTPIYETLHTDNLDEFDLLPYLKKKYGFTTNTDS